MTPAKFAVFIASLFTVCPSMAAQPPWAPEFDRFNETFDKETVSVTTDQLVGVYGGYCVWRPSMVEDYGYPARDGTWLFVTKENNSLRFHALDDRSAHDPEHYMDSRIFQQQRAELFKIYDSSKRSARETEKGYQIEEGDNTLEIRRTKDGEIMLQGIYLRALAPDGVTRRPVVIYICRWFKRHV